MNLEERKEEHLYYFTNVTNLNVDHWYFVLSLSPCRTCHHSHRVSIDLLMISATIVSSTAACHQVQWSSEGYRAGNGWQTKSVARSTREANVAKCGLFGSPSVGLWPSACYQGRGGKQRGKCWSGWGGCIHLADQKHWSALPNDYFTSTHLLLHFILFLPSASGFPTQEWWVGIGGEQEEGQLPPPPFLQCNWCCSCCC